MDERRELIYLAALLHDIGKFYQRADKSFTDLQSELSDYSKNLANDICPINDKGRFGYQHVVWTNEFFEKVQRKLDNIPRIKGNLYENNNNDCIANLACNHHKPQTILQSIITMADWWSAGIDRRNPIEQEEADDKILNINWGKTRYKRIPLYSIFNTIKVNEKVGGRHAFQLSHLDLDDKNFPTEIINVEDGVSQEKYKLLWDKFLIEFEKLPTDSIHGFTESLTYLLKKYTWCIPSNTMDMANVSLFDHLKTTAAFADCIYEFYTENEDTFIWNNNDKRLSLRDGEYPVLLLGGDISGIQKFIYNISSRKAATSLKGRSFYLQLMIDSIVQRFIMHDEIRATIGHVVYSSGGNFYMLLPNTLKVKAAIDEICKEIEKDIWNEQKGKLSANIDYIPFAYRNDKNEVDFPDAEIKDLGALWKALADKLSQRKNQKFRNLLINDFDDFFEIDERGGEVKVCAVTGEELMNTEISKVNETDNETIISRKVKAQIQLGEALKDVDFLITFKGNEENSTYWSNRLKHKTSLVGVANYLFDQIELTKDYADFRKISSADVSRVKRINNTDFLAAPIKGQKISYGFQFYGGNQQAVDNKGKNKTFEKLTRVNSEKENTESYFGVLRMDVDGLGDIFIKGFADEDKTFSAYATLSSHLDWFFSGYLNTIREKYKDNVNILYSGGDDVFAVGRWDLLIHFAEDIRNEFRQYVGREDVSISAGITIVGNKYPIAKAAELAGEAENEAKKYDDAKYSKKNAISFLGQTVSWEEEFDRVKVKKDQYINLINGHGMSKAILHKVMLFAEIQENNKRNKNKSGFTPDLSYYWTSAYFLTRFMEKKDDEVKIFCEILKTEIYDPRKLELNALAARWAELELKELLKTN